MSIVNTLSLESNRKIKINFDGGDLSSDAGLLLIKEFVSKLGIDKPHNNLSVAVSTKASHQNYVRLSIISYLIVL